MGRFKALWREKEKKLKPLMKIEENSNILEDTSDNLIHWSRHISNYPVKKRDHDYITVISQTSHKCEVIIKTSQ